VTSKLLGFEARVPANSSRYFSSANRARSQPLADVRLASRQEDPYIFNVSFEEELIKYDDSYCTTVVNLDQIIQIPTLDYFSSAIMPRLDSDARVIDIGCGQGEFVEALIDLGIDAFGFDPVLRESTPRLFPRYWSPDELPADLYVMRCVLPHIAEPWSFLDSIHACSSTALVLVEYQRIEWSLEHGTWYQVSHDHVNLFRFRDFHHRYHVIDAGTFSNGEWAWCLLDPSPRSARPILDDGLSGAYAQGLMRERAAFLQLASAVSRPLVIWGAAGKGIVLASALRELRDGLYVIDADPRRWGRHLEASGLEVLRPDEGLRTAPSDALVFVANPNHRDDVERLCGGRMPVLTTREFLTFEV